MLHSIPQGEDGLIVILEEEVSFLVLDREMLETRGVLLVLDLVVMDMDMELMVAMDMELHLTGLSKEVIEELEE